MHHHLDNLQAEAVELLKQLIKIPSLSREENQTGDLIAHFLQEKGVATQRLENNIWCRNKWFDASKPTILLNSHHDTVKPNKGYTRDPFTPEVVDGKLYGLGSNDAGGCLVALLSTFLYFYDQKGLKYNIIFAASAEEEIGGKHGMEYLFPALDTIDFAVVGEPTEMNVAIAEKGLMVLDCTAYGRSGHAARDEGENAIYKALSDIKWFNTYQFDEVSEALGPVKMTVTMVEAGTQHNVVPDRCHFVVDVRTTEKYSNQATLEIIQSNVKAEVVPRSTRLNPSGIPKNHPFVQAAVKLGTQTYGSPTLSDQALIPVTSVKMGPGKSARSHTPDEFIYVHEITEGINRYIEILNQLM